MKIVFTREEIAEMARVDAEIEATPLTEAEIRESELRDQSIIRATCGVVGCWMTGADIRRKNLNKQRTSNYSRQYYEENKARIAERRRRLREAKKAKAQEA